MAQDTRRFTCKEAAAALGIAPTRATDGVRRACAGVVRQLKANLFVAIIALGDAAEQDAAGHLPADCNWPAVKVTRLLKHNPAKALYELANSPAWSELDIAKLQRDQYGDRKLPWNR